MNGPGQLFAGCAVLLAGLFFLTKETGEDGLIGQLTLVDQLYLGFGLIFLIGVVCGATISMIVATHRAKRQMRDRRDG